MRKALALLSGGLDSILAAGLIKGLNIEVVALNMVIPFFQGKKNSSHCQHDAEKAAAQLGLRLVKVDVGEQMLELVKKPRFGYGSAMNPCIDCRILLLRTAKEQMAKLGAEFVISGEVVGQRPMSQRRQAMALIDRESGMEGLVLRPLSAQALEETIAEKNGWVERNKLLKITGRGRRPQIELANKLGINDYPGPGGGCLLTDKGFSDRLRDMFKHSSVELEQIPLLKTGRHFRLSPYTKLAVGRDEQENRQLEELAFAGDIIISTVEVNGPTALGRGIFSEADLMMASGIVGRYSDCKDKEVEINIRKLPDKQGRNIKIKPLEESIVKQLRI